MWSTAAALPVHKNINNNNNNRLHMERDDDWHIMSIESYVECYKSDEERVM